MSEITAEDVARVASSFARQELEVGARLERERIIKEIERDSHWFKIGVPCQCGAITPEQVDYVVALIKGENK